MANVKVTIKVSGPAKKFYVVGNTKNLGEWNPKNAVLVEDGVVAKQFADGETVEFKVLAGKNWDKVEKLANGDERENRSFVAKKGLVVEAAAESFNK
ncbi:MAG: hypothetical protein IJR67_04425 [Acholeplasmatales bacterium]|nr:hypothetical protein [Acholeplasmatales bacterium]